MKESTPKNKLQNKTNGLKLTKHNKAVFELFTQYKHLDANKIFNLLTAHQQKISLATIYRILSKFEANNLIVKHKFSEEIATFELFTPNEHHDHLICLNCHQVIEFCDETIEDLQNKIAQQNNFKITHHSLNIYGYCSNCVKSKTIINSTSD